MATMDQVKEAAKLYADNRELLALRVANLHTEIEELKRKHMPEILEAAGDTANVKETLAALIDESRELFAKPRSVIISGIRVGLKKGSGKNEIEDEEATIRLIHAHMPKKDWPLYIKTVEKVIKKPLEDLDGVTLKKIGVKVEGTGDVILIKATDSDVDKLVNAMLKEAAGQAEELEEAA